MNAPQAITELKKIQGQIQGLSTGSEKLITLIAFHLPEFINLHPALKRLWNEHIHYYRDLAKTEEYKTLVLELHIAMRQLHKEIDLGKLPAILNDPEFPGYDHQKAQTFKKQIVNFLKDEEWLALDESNWHSVLLQYTEELDNLLMLLHLRHGISDNAYEQYCARFKELSSKLRVLLETPWYRDSLKAFQDLQEFIDDPEHGRVQEFGPSYDKIREVADTVCTELLRSLDLKIAPPEQSFPFADTQTNFDNGVISNLDDASRSARLKKAKKLYIWKFLAGLNGREAPLTELNQYLNQNLKRTNHKAEWRELRATDKDFENLASTIAKISNAPVREINRCFQYGETVALRKIGS